jgi:Protein of unknown function (DUF3455)
MMTTRPPVLSTTLAAATLLSACAGTPMSTPPMAVFSQAALPAAVQVPAGHRVALETVGVGRITYECREKAALPGQHEWVFAGPEATLQDRGGRAVGRYFGPPATWALQDGSSLTGTQLAVAPAAPGSIPLQLVKANPAMGSGALVGVTHIQRVQTRGGVAPALPCGVTEKGRREVVGYQADYIFWKAA